MSVKQICNGCRRPRTLFRGRCAECRKDEERARDQAPLRRADPARRIRASAAWKGIRKLALDRDGNRCTYGLRRGEDVTAADGRCPRTRNLDVDHIRPISAGGQPFELRNLRSLCRPHHNRLEAARRRLEREEG